MIIASLSNSVNATEITLHRQTALRQARQEVTESTYDPATQVPLCQSEHEAWLAYWQPIWGEQANAEQVLAGWSHYTLKLAIETCSTNRMRFGWRQAQAAHNADTWRTIDSERIAEEAAEAILEEKDAKPGLNVDDDAEDFWIINDDTDCEAYVLDARAI